MRGIQGQVLIVAGGTVLLVYLYMYVNVSSKTNYKVGNRSIETKQFLKTLEGSILDASEKKRLAKMMENMTAVHSIMEKLSYNITGLKTSLLKYNTDIQTILKKISRLERIVMSSQSLVEYIDLFISQVKRKSGRDLLPTCSVPQNDFVYVKNHKCASDTMSVVFRRYGYTRDLNMVLPLENHANIGWPWKLEPWMYRASKDGKKFNILTDHTVYNETYMDSIMVPGAVYITSIREPFSHLKSAFIYFKFPEMSHIVDVLPEGHDPLFAFLNNMDHYDTVYQIPDPRFVRPCVPPHVSITKNLMSFNLGFHKGKYMDFRRKKGDKMLEFWSRMEALMTAPDFPYVNQENNITYIQHFLEHLDAKFAMVILVEYFHESLVMLKRMMCWSIKDIIYERFNTRHLRKTQSWYPQHLIDNYLRWSLADTLLYHHFNRTFWERVDVMGRDDFMEEVDNFEEVLEKAMQFCDGQKFLNDNTKVLSFPASKWNPAVEFSIEDCRIIKSPSGMRNEVWFRYDNDPRPVDQPKPPNNVVLPGC